MDICAYINKNINTWSNSWPDCPPRLYHFLFSIFKSNVHVSYPKQHVPSRLQLCTINTSSSTCLISYCFTLSYTLVSEWVPAVNNVTFLSPIMLITFILINLKPYQMMSDSAEKLKNQSWFFTEHISFFSISVQLFAFGLHIVLHWIFRISGVYNSSMVASLITGSHELKNLVWNKYNIDFKS